MEKLPITKIDSKYERARKRVEDIKGFYYNLVTYCLVIPLLTFINYKTSWGFQWFWFPLGGWGIGLGLHAYQVFVHDGFLGRRWEERKLQEFMDQEENDQRWK